MPDFLGDLFLANREIKPDKYAGRSHQDRDQHDRFSLQLHLIKNRATACLRYTPANLVIEIMRIREQIVEHLQIEGNILIDFLAG